MRNLINRALTIFSIPLLLVFNVQAVRSDCSQLTNNVSIIFDVDGQCAPTTVTGFDVTYKFSTAQNPNNIEIRIDWGDGSPIETYSIANGNLTPQNANQDFNAVGTHTFNDAGNCSYLPTATMLVNGVLCAGSEIERIANTWSPDNLFGGEFQFDDDVKEVCEGDGFTGLTFLDATEFNCRPAVEPDNPNVQPRFVQFVYGTNHNNTNGIRNLALNDGGVVNLTAGSGALTSTTTVNGVTGRYFGPVEEVPFPAVAPNAQTFPFDLAANAGNTPGRYFEITMFNWNFCNPYNGNPANPNYGDAISTTARILVVDDPTADINIIDGPNFCPGDRIRLRATNISGGTGDNTFLFRVFDNPAGTGAPIFESNGGVFTTSAVLNTPVSNITPAISNGFSAGDKKVELIIRDNGAIGNCENIIDGLFNITEAPVALIDFDYTESSGADSFSGTSNTTPLTETCFTPFDGVLNLTANINDISGNGFTYEWEFWRRRNAIGSLTVNPDSITIPNTPNLSLNITRPGVYQYILTARDLVNNCETFSIFTFIINSDPEADFTFTNVCLGEDNFFDPSGSNNNPRIDGDDINLYEWDFDYDGITFDIDRSSTNDNSFTRNLGGVNLYDVALRVSTNSGCSDILVETVEVRPNPDAILASDYTVPICPGETITFTNNSTPAASLAGISSVTYELEINPPPGFGPTTLQPIGQPIATLPINSWSNPGPNLTETYEVRLIATSNDGCPIFSDVISIDVKIGTSSDFNIYEGTADTNPLYDPGTIYCSPQEFSAQIDGATSALLSGGDVVNWQVFEINNGVQTPAPGGSATFNNADKDNLFTYNYQNDFPSTRVDSFNIVANFNSAGACIEPTTKLIRVFPRPTSNFTIIDTISTCDEVTYFFEAEQKGLSYNWDLNIANPADTLSSNIATAASLLQITFRRPNIGNPDLAPNVELITQNLTSCFSSSTDLTFAVPAQEDATITWNVDNGGDECEPVRFTVVNTSTTFPAGSEWRLKIVRINSALIRIDSITINGPAGNPEFRNTGANIYDTTIFQPDTYAFSLEATTPTNCIVEVTAEEIREVYPQPDPDFIFSQGNQCSPSTVTLRNISNNNGAIIDQEIWEIDSAGNNLITQINFGADYQYIFDNGSDAAFNYDVRLRLITDQGCDTVSATQQVTVLPKPQSGFLVVPDTLKCADVSGGNTFTFTVDFDDVVFAANPTGTEYQINWDDGTIETTDQDTVETHVYTNFSASSAIQYTITVTATTPDLCVRTETQNIFLNPSINADLTSDKTEICSGETINFSGNPSAGATYLFQFREQGSAVPFTDFDTPNPTNGFVGQAFTNTSGSPITYEVLLTKDITANSLTCTDTDTLDILVYSEFVSSTPVGPDRVCALSSNVTYSVPNQAGFTYIWSNASITSGAGTNEITVSFGTTDVELRLVEVDPNGCRGDTSRLAIDVLEIPQGIIETDGPEEICLGEQTTIKFDLLGANGLNDGLFDVTITDGVNDTTFIDIAHQQSITIEPTQSTSYRLLNIIDKEDGCEGIPSNDIIFITVEQPPTASITDGAVTVCEGDPAFLFVLFNGRPPFNATLRATTSSGTTDTPITSTTGFEFYTVNPTDTTAYTVVDLTGSPLGCVGTTSGVSTVNVNPLPTVVISGDHEGVCNGDSREISFALTGTPPWTVTYNAEDGLGNFRGTFFLTDVIPDPGFNPATDTWIETVDVTGQLGENIYTISSLNGIRGGNGCIGTGSGQARIVTLNAPTASLTGNAVICEGQSTDLVFELVGEGGTNGDGSPFTVEYTNTIDTFLLSNRAADFNETITPDSSLVYRITSVLDVNGCSALNLGFPVVVTVNEPPTAELIGADTICFGEEINLQFDLTGIGPWDIVYNDGSSNISFKTPFNRHFEPINPATTTTYTLVSVSDGNTPVCNGAILGDPVTITVFPELGAAFTATPAVQTAPSSTVTVVNNTQNKSFWDYTWDYGDGFTTTDQDPPPYEYTQLGTFIIKMEATNGTCTETFQQTVTIEDGPALVDFIGRPVEGCVPLLVEFENLTRFSDPATYRWEFGDNQRATGVVNPTHLYNTPGVYTVSLTARNSTGQDVEEIKTEYIVVNEAPQASFTIPDDFRQVFTAAPVQFVNTSIGADAFIWRFGDGNTSNDRDPIHAYADSGVYDVTIIAINTTTGCQDSFALDAQVQVILGGESKVANAFTPNRSGPGSASPNPQDNDIFLPQVEGVNDFNMKVYNRWGELLFESSDQDQGWDGYYKGQLMPQGVYVYRLELTFENGRREAKVGDITLIR